MHLLVLSAFRREPEDLCDNNFQDVSMHLLVLSAFRRTTSKRSVCDVSEVSQCTFWCSVLSDDELTPEQAKQLSVSMHLLVLSAFRPGLSEPRRRPPASSQCTFWCSVLSDLNGDALDEYLIMVSMHLLVLSACRLSGEQSRPGVVQSQCTFWCSVLSDEPTSIGTT